MLRSEGVCVKSDCSARGREEESDVVHVSQLICVSILLSSWYSAEQVKDAIRACILKSRSNEADVTANGVSCKR